MILLKIKRSKTPLKDKKKNKIIHLLNGTLIKYAKDQVALINNDKSNANWYFLRYADVLLTLCRSFERMETWSY